MITRGWYLHVQHRMIIGLARRSRAWQTVGVTVMEIGRGKSGRRAYALDEIGIVPSRRTRRPEDASSAGQIDAYRFELPLATGPMDSVVSPATAIAIGKRGRPAVLGIE